MKRKLITLTIMEGVDLFFVAVSFIMLYSFFPSLTEIKFLNIIMLILMFIGIISVWFAYIYCIVHVSKNKELSPNKRTLNILLIVFLSIFYVPIYYTKYVIKDKKWWGILNCILYSIFYLIVLIAMIVGIIYSFGVDSLREPEKIIEYTTDGVATIELNDNYICDTEDIGSYVLSCSNKVTGEFIGIFNYNNAIDTVELLDFHVNQLVDAYKEDGYKLKEQYKENNLERVKIQKNNNNYYIIVKVEDNNLKTKSVLIYFGNNEKTHEEVFPTFRLINLETY